MQITAEYLRGEIAKMQMVVAAHNGAIEFAQNLLAQLERKDHLTEQELAEMVAGNGAVVESIEAVE